MNIHDALCRKIITGRDIIPWGYGVGPSPYDRREIWIYPIPFNHLMYWFGRLHQWLRVSRQHELITVAEADRRVEAVRQAVTKECTEENDAGYIEGFRHGWRSCEGGFAFVRKCAPLMARRTFSRRP